VAAVSASASGTRRQPLFPNVRRSPYFERTEAAGALEYMVYNHMYMPIVYDNDPRAEYRALRDGVCLWDVGAERQTQLRGADALAFANYLCTRDLRSLETGRCRFTMVCDERGEVMTEPIVLRPWEDVVWISHGDTDLTLWARGLAAGSEWDVEVSEPDVAPVQVQGPKALETLASLVPKAAELEYYRCVPARLAGADVVVSRTGWSKELAFEVYVLGSESALDVWDAIVAAGEPHGLVICGPNLSLAVEQAITDNHYYVNSGMTPYEAGASRLIDLESAPFVGSDALAAMAGSPPARRSVGILFDEAPGRLEGFWPVEQDGKRVGEVRWAAYSYAIERDAGIALVASTCAPGAEVTVAAPRGPVRAELAELPLVS
jgi:glycine cleavage system aminomethyltransferase T